MTTRMTPKTTENPPASNLGRWRPNWGTAAQCDGQLGGAADEGPDAEDGEGVADGARRGDA